MTIYHVRCLCCTLYALCLLAVAPLAGEIKSGIVERREYNEAFMSSDEFAKNMSLVAQLDYDTGVLTLSISTSSRTNYVLDINTITSTGDCTLVSAEGIDGDQYVALAIFFRNPSTNAGEDNIYKAGAIQLGRNTIFLFSDWLWDYKPEMWKSIVHAYNNTPVKNRERIALTFSITPRLCLLDNNKNSIDTGYRLTSRQSIIQLNGKQIKKLIDIKNNSKETKYERKPEGVELSGTGNENAKKYFRNPGDIEKKVITVDDNYFNERLRKAKELRMESADK